METAELLQIKDTWNVSFAICITFAGLALFSCILRFLSRRKQGSGLDDKLMVLAFAFVAAASGLEIWLSCKEVPVQQSDIKGDLVPKINFTIQLCWIFVLWTTTSSALVYYYRVFKDEMDTWKAKLRLWIPFALVSFWSISCLALTVFIEGWPPSRYWTTGPNKAYRGRILYTNVTHVFVDIWVLLTPVPFVLLKERRPQRSWRRRIRVLVILLLFLTGLLTTAASIVRFTYLIERFDAPETTAFRYSIVAVMCSVIEANLAIFCANLPTLRYNAFWEWISSLMPGDISGEPLYNDNFGGQEDIPLGF